MDYDINKILVKEEVYSCISISNYSTAVCLGT